MKYFFLILLLIYAIGASATEVRFGGWSKHLGTNTDYNETHNAFLVEHNNFMGGYFKNSFNSDSGAIGYFKNWQVEEGIDFRLTGGLIYGYRDCLEFNKNAQAKHQSKNVCPMVYPEIRFTDTPLRPSFSLFGNAAVLMFGVEL